jgi:hypothetical protein
MDCMIQMLLAGAANISIADSYSEDISYAPRRSSIPRQRIYTIVRALGGVAVDAPGEGGDEPARLDWKLADDERGEDIPEVERWFTRLCGDLVILRRASPFAADDDAFRMKPKSASRPPSALVSE